LVFVGRYADNFGTKLLLGYGVFMQSSLRKTLDITKIFCIILIFFITTEKKHGNTIYYRN
jgi:hypothetical protein